MLNNVVMSIDVVVQVDDDEIEDDDGFEAPAIVMRDLSEQQDDDEFDF